MFKEGDDHEVNFLYLYKHNLDTEKLQRAVGLSDMVVLLGFL